MPKKVKSLAALALKKAIKKEGKESVKRKVPDDVKEKYYKKLDSPVEKATRREEKRKTKDTISNFEGEQRQKARDYGQQRVGRMRNIDHALKGTSNDMGDSRPQNYMPRVRPSKRVVIN